VNLPRKTLAVATAPVTGVGVRTGQPMTVRLLPAESGAGLALARTDLGVSVPLDLRHALDAPSCTAVGTGLADATLFVEHVMATLHIHGLTDLVVEVSGPEIPLLDGTALPWQGAILAAGVRELSGHVEALVVGGPVRLEEGDKWISAHPAAAARYEFELAYANPQIGVEAAIFEPAVEDFATMLAPARTFALVEEIEQAAAAGLLKGGSEENCRIVYADHVSDPPTLPDEYARHKLLDMLGDLYLAGRPIVGRITGHRTGHSHNRALLRQLAALW
jgi:UDP-3-O-[3-hydroxymyristoyl] N-acetylglucosamine deacetylase